MLNIIGALIALGILVTVHEAGHFIAARFFGVEIEKFSIGFGPKLLSFKRNKTEYRISLIPFGGYLKMKGENPDEEIEDAENSFLTKKWWKRALIAFSGPFANFLFALIIFIATFTIGKNYQDHFPIVGISSISDFVQENDQILTVNDHEITSWSEIIKFTESDKINIYEIEREEEKLILENLDIEPQTWMSEILPFAPAIIGEVYPGLPAYQAGLMEKDEILSVDGIQVNSWYEMRNLVKENVKKSLIFEIKRGGNIFEKSIALEENILSDNKMIGIVQWMPLKMKETFSFFESIELGTITTVNFVYLNYSALFKLMAHPSEFRKNLGGPVMIYTMSQQTAKKGLDSILTFVAAISILLMIMNLLPIPILDGGHIFFCFIEGISQKSLSLKTQMAFQRIGFMILLMLMFFAFFNDFNRIFKRNISIQEQTEQTEAVR